MQGRGRNRRLGKIAFSGALCPLQLIIDTYRIGSIRMKWAKMSHAYEIGK